MVSATRLLPAARGGSGFTVPGLPGAFVRSASNPILAPAIAWEQTSMQEPLVLREGATWKMWAKGGWATTGIGYYTSTDGLTWSRYASNPVLGAGGSGFAPEVSQPEVLNVGGTYWMWFNSGGDTDPNTPRYATSPDGIAWTVQGSGSYITNPGTITQWGNHHVWIEGATWYMLQEARVSARWRMFIASSSDGASWTIGNAGAALSTLEASVSHNVGGPWMPGTPTYGGLYQLWYHSGTGDTSDLFHATSPDRITWTIGAAILTHSGTGNEVDQIADPSLVRVGSTWYMFFAGVDNVGQTGRILLATAPAT